MSKLAIIVLEFESNTSLCETHENIDLVLLKAKPLSLHCDYSLRICFSFIQETLHELALTYMLSH